MSQTLSYKELEKQYGLEPIPESVLRLTQLVARQDADLDEIAKMISTDPELTLRLLRAANPRAESDADFTVDTVEEALMRTGMGCVLLLAMGTPLKLAILKTFQTMAGIRLESVHPGQLPALSGPHLLGRIGFTGKAEGRVELRLSLPAARRVAAAVLGIPEAELTDPTVIADTMGELLNIVTGNFKSNLCDAGLDCRLQTPSVAQTDNVKTEVIPGGGIERMAFRGPQFHVFVAVIVNPWAA